MIHFFTGERAPCKARISLDNYTHDPNKVTCPTCREWLDRKNTKTKMEGNNMEKRKRPTKIENPTSEAHPDSILIQLQKVAANMNEALGFDPPIPADSEDMDVLQEAIKEAATEIFVEDNPSGENVKKTLAENPEFPYLSEGTWDWLVNAGMLAHLKLFPEKTEHVAKKERPSKEKKARPEKERKVQKPKKEKKDTYTRDDSIVEALNAMRGGDPLCINDIAEKANALYISNGGSPNGSKKALRAILDHVLKALVGLGVVRFDENKQYSI